MIHLDTTLLIDLLRESARTESGPAHRFLETHSDEEIAVSIHAVCELWAGAESAGNPAREREAVAALVRSVSVVRPDERFPRLYGRLYSELRRRGQTVAAMDLLIATSALVDEAPLATRNVADFERMPGLHVLSY